MKTLISFTFLFLITSSVSAQDSTQTKWEVPALKPISFNYIENSSNSIVLRVPSQSLKVNHFLKGAGYLLQGLKFSSAIDQFNAVAPFDFRAYEPMDFSSYSHSIQNNYLLAQPIQPIK